MRVIQLFSSFFTKKLDKITDKIDRMQHYKDREVMQYENYHIVLMGKIEELKLWEERERGSMENIKKYDMQINLLLQERNEVMNKLNKKEVKLKKVG